MILVVAQFSSTKGETVDPKSIADISTSAVGIVTTLLSWGGVIILFLVFRNFIIAGISRAFIQVFENGTRETRETLIRFFVDKNATYSEVYAKMKSDFESGTGGGL
jgi:hypothetical protein